MSNQKGIDFLKNRIKARLAEVSDQMGKYRYKLYIAMVDECNDFEELKEMAELDLQMDLFDYVRHEINPMLDELNLSIADVRRMDSGEIPSIGNPLQNYEIEPSEMEELLDDEEANAAMAMLLMSRIKTEPDEERYRQEILDFQLEEKMEVDSIDDIQIDEDDGLNELLEADETDEEPESDDSEESEDDLEELAGFFDDMPEDADVEEGTMSEDEIFVDIDEDDFIVPDDDKMTEDEIFSDIDDDELEGFMEEPEDSDETDENEDDPFSDIEDISDYDFGDIETGDESDGLDDLDDDDFEGLENFENDDDFLDDSDDVESSDSDDMFGDIDEDELMLDDGEDEPEDSDPFSDIDDSELDGFADLEDGDDEPEDSDPFSDIDDSELDGFSDDEDEEETAEDDDPFSDIDIDDIGVLDDSDEFFSNNAPETNKPVPAPKNAVMHSPEVPTRASGIKPTTVFNNGTERGMKTQSMFNMFNNIGIGSAKAAKMIKTQTKKVASSKFLSMGFGDDTEIDF